MHVRTGRLLLFALLLLILLVGCNRQPERKPSPPPLPVGVSVAVEDEDLARLWEETARKEEKQQIKVIFKNSGGSADRQEQDLEQMLQSKVKAMVVLFAGQETAERMLPRIIAQEIKVIALYGLPANLPIDGYVGPDFARVGQLMAEALIEGEGAGNQVLQLGNLDDPASKALQDALQQGLQGSGLDLVTREEPSWDSRAVAQVLSEVHLPGLRGIAAPTSGAAVDMARSLRDLGADRVITVGVGGSKQAAQAIQAGWHDAEVDTSLEMMLQTALGAARDLVKDDRWNYESWISSGSYDIPARHVPVRLVTKQNIYILANRWGELKQEKEQQDQQQSGGSEKSQSSESKQGNSDQKQSSQSDSSQPTTKVTIKTKDGKSMEIDVPGDVESIKINQAPSEGKKSDE